MNTLEWRQVGKHKWCATDGGLRYYVHLSEGFRWRVRLNNELLGDAKGFTTFEEAAEWIEWGGTPNRQGYNRETGEICQVEPSHPLTSSDDATLSQPSLFGERADES